MAELGTGGNDTIAAKEQAGSGNRLYWLVALVLTILTLAEVAAVHIPALNPVIVPILVVLSAVKFVLVVMFYMHLKGDHRVYTAVFVAPLTLAVGAVIIMMLIIFKVLAYV